MDGFGRQSVRVVLEAFNLLYHYDLRVFCSTTSPLNQAHIAPCREYLLMFPLNVAIFHLSSIHGAYGKEFFVFFVGFVSFVGKNAFDSMNS